MVNVLLVLLAALDLVLLGVIFFLGKRRFNPRELLLELNEEMKHLKELRLTVKEELEAGQSKNRSSVDKLSKVATEAEYEIKIAKEEMEKEIDKVLTKLSDRISDPLNKLSKRQASIETLLKKVDREKIVLQKSVSRAEKLAKFFKKDVPYEEVLKDIEDKKYADAKHLLSMGYKPKQVAQELGMPISEVNFLASVSP